MQEAITQFLRDYPLLAPFAFIILRALAIIISPIPGILIDIPGMLVFGWLLGFVYAEVGIMLGAMAAFFIARRFRRPLLGRFVKFQVIERWEDRLSDNEKFWTLVAIRLPTNPLFDYISYASGLTSISWQKFFLSTLLGNIPSVFLTFYLGGLSAASGKYYFISFLVGLIIVSIIYAKKSKQWF